MQHRYALPLTAVAMMATLSAHAQCPGGTEVTLFSNDFEVNDGGLVGSGGLDWEWGTIPSVLLDTSDCSALFEHPPGAASGTKGWGTELNGCYDPLGVESTVTLTVDLSPASYTSAQLEWQQWFNVFVNFDYMTLRANGTTIYFNDTTQDSFAWEFRTADLTPFLGDATVDISFSLFATTVVNLAGWYLDDIAVTACDAGGSAISDNGAQQAPRLWFTPDGQALHLNVAGTLAPGAVLMIHDALGRATHQWAMGNDRHVYVPDLRAGSYVAALYDARGTPLVRTRFVMR